MTTALDDRISQLAGKNTRQQVAEGLSIILNSPNGEAPFVFKAIDNEAREQLGRKVDARYGLMTGTYLREQVDSKLLVADLMFNNADKLVQFSYVLFESPDVVKLKEHLKTNSGVQTHIIGESKGMIGALLPCDDETAEKISAGYGRFGVARYSHGDRFDGIHKKAVRGLLGQMREEIHVGLSAKDPKADDLIAKYLALKDEYKL
jgi:hypothetical protein